ncbi:MAG: hypothetical protein CL920_14735 [Deltaproteobacteria bacterium]|nr:hypothetical protein [Deltaproteobacteria bacterium]MBU49941.1 hypothetical protein [Deltaproteobacteria bacterium]|tara:strand:- start:6112 stop:8598 length:2487 start_codon:yes stop_codon:yes gene_type:complete
MKQRIWMQCLLYCLALALLFSPACGRETVEPAPQTKDNISTKQQAIINGKQDSAYPAAGSLTANQQSFCTGTLIASRVVLTAAHCIDAFAQYQGQSLQFRIDIPYENLKYRTIYADIDVANTEKHPQYSGQQGQAPLNDVAVVILKAPVFAVAPMPWQKTKPPQTWIGTKAMFMGYGRLSATATGSAPRKYSTLIPITGIDPKDAAGQTKTNQISYEDPSTSVCQGDSGGPAFYNVNGVMTLIAVTSHGTSFSCNGTNYSFRTDPYAAWIESFITKFAVCSSKADCGPCSDCKNNACVPIAVTANANQCKVCSTDADCTGGGTCMFIGTGLRCMYACNSNGCCPSGNVCGTEPNGGNHCLPEPMVCPDVKCSKDSDCSPKEICGTGGTCEIKLPALDPKTCHPCTKSADCATGGYCNTPDGRGGTCLQPCDNDLCPKGFKCEVVSGIKQCLPTNGQCLVACKANTDCPTGFECKSDSCVRTGGGEVGEQCSTNNPCKTGLNCIANGNETRCYQTCGTPEGSAGSPCRAGNQCDPGLTCYPNPLGGKAICVESCQGGAPCKLGGTCLSFAGICICQNDAECGGNGRTCNKIISFGGACTDKQAAGCPAGEVCSSGSIGQDKICLKKNEATRGIGQSCSAANTCKDGLICAPLIDVCVESCSATKKCTQGGQCQSLPIPGASTQVCLCDASAPCPVGTKCNIIQQINAGYCQADGSGACQDDSQCPSGFVCQNQQCVQAGTEPKPEPKPEPAPEPAPKEPTAEPAAEAATPDAGTTEKIVNIDSPGTTQDTGTPAAPKACGCQTTSPTPDFSHLLLGLWLLLLPLFRKRS